MKVKPTRKMLFHSASWDDDNPLWIRDFLGTWLPNFNKTSRHFSVYHSKSSTKPVTLIHLLESYQISLLGWYKVVNFQNYVLKISDVAVASIHSQHSIWKTSLCPYKEAFCILPQMWVQTQKLTQRAMDSHIKTHQNDYLMDVVGCKCPIW